MKERSPGIGFVGFNYAHALKPTLDAMRRLACTVCDQQVSAAAVAKAAIMLGLEEPVTPAPPVIRKEAPFTGTLIPEPIFDAVKERAEAENCAPQQMYAHLLACGLRAMVRDLDAVSALFKVAEQEMKR